MEGREGGRKEGGTGEREKEKGRKARTPLAETTETK